MNLLMVVNQGSKKANVNSSVNMDNVATSPLPFFDQGDNIACLNKVANARKVHDSFINYINNS
ncbi:hypothetical protein PIROE2DRAFT_13704 [Piromyces sp. E2]|nr:hypothetical protein PIROE2DRAFT_13704 [Piromyces sp. E2]|eukprot:OUM60508.1 hypothetical protein PIROE2DRAFT_13704 [Piromyces sp. E2]